MNRRDVLRAAVAAALVPVTPAVAAPPVVELRPGMMYFLPQGWTVTVC